MTRARSCIDCGRITTQGNRCDEHRQARQQELAERRPWARRRKTKAWQRLRWAVLERDGFTCRIRDCGHHDPSGRTLQAHHIQPLSEGGTDDLWNLLTVCRQHHHEVERHRTSGR